MMYPEDIRRLDRELFNLEVAYTKDRVVPMFYYHGHEIVWYLDFPKELYTDSTIERMRQQHGRHNPDDS